MKHVGVVKNPPSSVLDFSNEVEEVLRAFFMCCFAGFALLVTCRMGLF